MPIPQFGLFVRPFAACLSELDPNMILAMAKALTKPLHLIKATGAVEIKASEDLPLSASSLSDWDFRASA
jgi:hypothetical protein